MRVDIGPTVGPFVVIDTKPPYKPWDGNQATYLFFPVFASMMLTLMGTLSAPVIPGLSTVNVHSKYGEGIVKLGAWGLCIDGFPHEVIFANNTEALAKLPTGVLSMGISPSAVDDSYKIANAIMHVSACFVTWLSVTWTLAASGEFHNKGKGAFSWTRCAWWTNTASLIMGLVPFALDLAEVAKTSAMVKTVEDLGGKVTAGPTIYMSAASVFLNLITVFVRYLWARRQPRPNWSQGDFHVEPSAGANTDVAGAAESDEPPTWESLNLDSTQRAQVDHKAEWTRADGALESIDEKRASLVRDGYAV